MVGKVVDMAVVRIVEELEMVDFNSVRTRVWICGTGHV